MSIQDFVSKGISVTNSMGEKRTTNEGSICFPNGWVGSIIHHENDYSVAACDWDGYFDWHVLPGHSEDKWNYGAVICKTEDEVCAILSFIESLPDNWSKENALM